MSQSPTPHQLGSRQHHQIRRVYLIAIGLIVLLSIAFIGGAAFLLHANRRAPTELSAKSASTRQTITISSDLPAPLTERLKQALAGIDALASAAWVTAPTVSDIQISSTTTDANLAFREASQLNRDFVTNGDLLVAGASFGVQLTTDAARTLEPALKTHLTKTFSPIPTNQARWNYLALGDIIPARDVYTVSKRLGYQYPFLRIADRAKSANLTVANLETTVADGQTYGEGPGMMRFTAPTAALDGLTLAGIDGVNLANNHAMNGGGTAVNTMLSLLKTRGVGAFGVARTGEPTSWTTTVQGVRITHLSYDTVPGNIEPTTSSPGATRLPLSPWGTLTNASINRVQVDIRAAKTQADVVIPWFHWGTEYTHVANTEQRRLAQAAVDAGAETVIASHPHWVQGVELYKDHLIAYSLGNFVFDQNWSEKTKQSFALSLGFQGNRVVSAKLEPAVIENQVQPRWLAPTEPLYRSILRDVATNSWLQ